MKIREERQGNLLEFASAFEDWVLGHPAQVHLNSLVASMGEPIEVMGDVVSCLVSSRHCLFFKTSIASFTTKVGRLTNLRANPGKLGSLG